ncbi:MAG: PAS domain S-box protein, partial [Deltaproteobacteria bacterium]|nr:PAS domain S-box protein [Deltaproteobacteria bacterium]
MDNRYDYIDSAKEIEKNLQVEASLTRLLYKNHPIAAIAVIVNSLIIAVVMWREVAPRVVVIWAAVNITLQVIRFLMYISFTRSAPKDAEMPIWRKRFVVSMGVSGLVFGSSAIFIFPLGSLPHQVFLAFVMGGMASGALGFFSSSTMAFTLYIVPVIGIITVRFFMQDGLIPISMGIMATIFLVLLLVTARRMRGYLYANFSLNRDLQREVSEHKKTETKLKDAYETARENEKKFHDIFVNASDGIILAGVESKRFISANPMICKMIGYEEGELKGLGIMDIHPAEDLPYIIGEFEKQAEGEIKIAANIPVKRKDG